MADDSGRYWFRAKRYGYGWGLPSAWQGWAVYIGYAVVVLGPLTLGTLTGALLSLGAALVATPLLMWVCVRKGEPAAWRWGRDREPR